MRPTGRRGATLLELVLAAAILGIIMIAFSAFLRYAVRLAVQGNADAQGQEEVRRALQRAELELVHANEITVASTTLVEFIVDRDRAPGWNRDGDDDGDGIPNWRDTDSDGDAQAIQPSSAAWRSGFNLTDDDENGDGFVDARKRLYLQGGTLWLDTSVDGEAWGGRREKLLTGVSTFTLTYWGNKANNLGSGIDANNDGVVSAAEMDAALPPSGAGNANGALDLRAERAYITTIRLDLGADPNRDGKTNDRIETDVYPPLLPLKPLQ